VTKVPAAGGLRRKRRGRPGSDWDDRPYFQGPAIRVLARGFTEHLHGLSRPFSRFARTGLTKAGHLPAQDKLRQLQALGARLYACAGSMRHFKVAKTDLAFDGVTIAEYLTFTEVMRLADINLFVQ
jgi:predicted peroxiredoxin